MAGLIATGRECGWWWPFKNLVVITDRPLVLHRDERTRLHCEDGPAIAYRDGFGIYAWHGVRVNAHVITKPETITLAEIDKTENIEVRRVMVERYGVGRYLGEIGAKVVDMDALKLEGSACRILLREPKSGDQWLEGTDGSTARVYFMNVPREVQTCREAHNAIAGFDETRLIAEA